MILTENDIRALAETAKVALSEGEAEAMTAYFNDAVPFCGAISKAVREGRLKLDDVPPYAPGAVEDFSLREDAVDQSSVRDEVLAAAPETGDGFFVVPRILEEE